MPDRYVHLSQNEESLHSFTGSYQCVLHSSQSFTTDLCLSTVTATEW